MVNKMMAIFNGVARLSAWLVLVLAVSGCLGMPEKVEPVQPFEVQRYMGKWYEIARLDHRFERGLTNITAEYSLRENGGVNVLNRGYAVDKQEWVSAKGKAFFVESENEAYLKVSFFGPFYGSYVVFGLDQAQSPLKPYEYAFVSGPDHSYLWFLARDPVVPESLMARFKQAATDAGFDVDKLIYVAHDSAQH